MAVSWMLTIVKQGKKNEIDIFRRGDNISTAPK